MKMQTPCLATGPYDWSPDILPRAEFDARLERLRMEMNQRNVQRLAVHGNAFDHAALAWLTGFTPKLGPAFALVDHDGSMRILFSGGPGMRPSALRLTFVEDVTAMRGGGDDVAKWFISGLANGLNPGLVEGDAMLQETFGPLMAAMKDHRTPTPMDAEINALRRSKTRAELAVVRQAIRILDTTTRMFQRFHRDMGRRSAMVAAESAAYAFGAQDARFRLSAHAFGPPAPLDDDDAPTDHPAQAAIAIRYAGYWAVGLGMFGDAPASLRERVRATLADVMERARGGADITKICAAADIDLTIHGVGLAMNEAPQHGETLVEGDIFNIVMTAKAGENQTCAWSALARADVRGQRLLWASPDLEMPVARD